MKSKSSSQVSLHPTNLNDRVACPGLSYLASNLWFLTMFYFCSKKMTLRTNVGIIYWLISSGSEADWSEDRSGWWRWGGRWWTDIMNHKWSCLNCSQLWVNMKHDNILNHLRSDPDSLILIASTVHLCRPRSCSWWSFLLWSLWACLGVCCSLAKYQANYISCQDQDEAKLKVECQKFFI